VKYKNSRLKYFVCKRNKRNFFEHIHYISDDRSYFQYTYEHFKTACVTVIVFTYWWEYGNKEKGKRQFSINLLFVVKIYWL